MVSLANQYTDNSNFANVSNPIFGRPRVVQSRTRQSHSRDDAPTGEVEVNIANQYADTSEFRNSNPLKQVNESPRPLQNPLRKDNQFVPFNERTKVQSRTRQSHSRDDAPTGEVEVNIANQYADTSEFRNSNPLKQVNESPRPLQNPLRKDNQFVPFNERTKVQGSTPIGGKRLHDKHKYNSRKKRKNKQKSHKKKYNVKYMSKRHPRRRHSRKRHCSNRQRGGVFGAAQYNETLYGSNAEQQQQHLLNGSLYPSAQGIQTAHTYQGGLRRSGLRRKRGGSLGFIGANVVPATLFATNMIYGNSIKSQRYKKMNNRTYRRR